MPDNIIEAAQHSAIEIRPVRPGDFDDLLALFEAVAAERQWIGTEPGFDKERYRATWQGMVDGNGGVQLVAYDGQELVGALHLFPLSNGNHDLGMLVSREHRGKGIGRMLLHAGFAWAQSQNVEKLTLGVFPHNTAAIKLYESAGFVTVRRLEREIVRATGDVWDVIVMEKAIDALR